MTVIGCRWLPASEAGDKIATASLVSRPFGFDDSLYHLTARAIRRDDRQGQEREAAVDLRRARVLLC